MSHQFNDGLTCYFHLVRFDSLHDLQLSRCRTILQCFDDVYLNPSPESLLKSIEGKRKYSRHDPAAKLNFTRKYNNLFKFHLNCFLPLLNLEGL